MNAVAAIQVVSALLTLGINAMQAAQAANELIQKARSEGRDVTEAELQSLQQTSEALTVKVIQALQEASKR